MVSNRVLSFTKPIVTPTFSKDRAIVQENSTNPCRASFDEACKIAAKWDVIHCPLLRNREELRFGSESSWHSLFEFCDALSIEQGDGKKIVDLNKVLRKCYEIAFSMPPSPTLSTRSPSTAYKSQIISEDPTVLQI